VLGADMFEEDLPEESLLKEKVGQFGVEVGI